MLGYAAADSDQGAAALYYIRSGIALTLRNYKAADYSFVICLEKGLTLFDKHRETKKHPPTETLHGQQMHSPKP